RRQPLGQLAAGAVSLAVAAVPEGLPLLSSVAQLSAARRLARHGILVRNTRAIEALGRVQVMCVDKTGTVTEGRLSLTCVAFLDDTEEPLDGLSELGRKLLRAGLRATPKPPPAGRLPPPTDAAVAEAAGPAGAVRRPEAGDGAARPRRRAGPEPDLPRLPGHRRSRPADGRRRRGRPAGGGRLGGDDHRRPPEHRRGHRRRARAPQRP